MGWPKGVKRGENGKPLTQETDVTPPATSSQGAVAPPPPPPPAYRTDEPPEPVTVEAITVSGQEVTLSASSFIVQNGRYIFTSYPPMRGYKRITILKADQLAMLAVTAPEEMAETLKAPQVAAPAVPVFPGTDAVTGAMGAGPIVYGPPLQRAPYADPRQPFKDPRAESARSIPNAPGIPVSEISGSGDREVFGDHRKANQRQTEVIGATMG